MERRALGRTPFKVAPLAFGGNVFGWTIDEPTSFRLLDAFVGAGFNLIDTADSYSRWAPGNAGGESETIIGRWLARRGNADDVVIATKVGSEMGPHKKGLSKAYILRAHNKLNRARNEPNVDAHIELYKQAYADCLMVNIKFKSFPETCAEASATICG